jgi:hypothetical protein
MESKMETYKKKYDESLEIQHQNKSLISENEILLQRFNNLEKQFLDSNSLKPLIENYKEKVLELENKNIILTTENNRLSFEFEQLKENHIHLQQQKELDDHHIKTLEERLQDTQHFIGDEGEAAASGNLELELEGKKKEEEGKEKRDDEHLVVILQHQLDDCNRIKQRFEKDYLQEHRKVLELEKQLTEVRKGGGGHMEAINKLLMEKDELQKQNIQAKDQILALERKNNLVSPETSDKTLKEALEKVSQLTETNASLQKTLKKAKEVLIYLLI